MANHRDSNIELLRIVLMSMIVLTHFYVHGVYNILGGGSGHGTKEVSYLGWMVVSLIDYHVVCFFFISGYYGIKTKVDSLVGYLVKLAFYGVVTYIIWGILRYGFDFRRFLGVKNLAFYLTPFTFFGGRWWFAESYFFLMLVAPFLNKSVDFVPKRVFAGLLVLLVVFLFFGNNDPFDPMTAIMVYLVGRYLKKWPIRVIEDKALLIYIVALMVLLANTVIHICVLNDNKFRLSTDYNSPVILIAGISFFFLFKNIKMKNRAWINWISSGVFGVYLLTDGFLRDKFNFFVVGVFGENVFVLAMVAVAITLTLSAFNGVLEHGIVNPAAKFLSNTIRKLAIRIVKS